MMRAVVAVGVLMLGATAVIAQQDQLKETQTIMKGNGKNAGALSAIVKGEKPYDQATVDAALAQFDDTAKKLPKLFPASLKGQAFEGDYGPRPRSGTTRPALTSISRASPRRSATPRARSRMPTR